MLESIKYADLHSSHSTSPVHDCCISLLTQSSRPYAPMFSLHYGISHFVFCPAGVSSGSGYWRFRTKPEKNPTYQTTDVFCLSQNCVPVTPAGQILSPDITVAFVYIFITTVFIYKDVRVYAKIIVFCSPMGQLKASLKYTAPKCLLLLLGGKRSQTPSPVTSSKGDHSHPLPH